jgi:hypothetical protein
VIDSKQPNPFPKTEGQSPDKEIIAFHSLPCSQQLVICLTPEPDGVHTIPFTPWSSRYLFVSCTAPKPCVYFSSRWTCYLFLSVHSAQICDSKPHNLWKFRFKVLPSSRTVSRFSSSIQVFWKMCFAHWLQPFVLRVLLISYFLIWSTHLCILKINYGTPNLGISSILPLLPNFGS